MNLHFDTYEKAQAYFTKLGFNEGVPSPLEQDNIIAIFQKRYDDEKGKKYFLNVRLFDFTQFPKAGKKYQGEIECQLYKNGTHDAVNLEFLDWTVEAAVEFVEKLFDNGLIEHYELR